MKERTLTMKIIVFLAVIVFSFTVFAGLPKPQTQTLDNTIPLEDQAQIIIHDDLYRDSIDGKPWPWMGRSRTLNVPAGTHTFVFNYIATGGSSGNITTYSARGLSHTDTFESGKLYKIMPQWDKLGSGGSIWLVTSHEGYSEFKRPGPDETLVVLRRATGGLGNLGELVVTVDEKDSYSTWAGQTSAILLPKGEHKLQIGNRGSVYITIDAGGGTKRYFAVSRPSNGLIVKVKVKETKK